MNCYALKSVVLPSELTELPWSIFSGCYALTDIIIPDGVTYIDDGAFNDCKSLAALELPSGISYIDSGTIISGCSSLNSLIIPEGVTAMPTIDASNTALFEITIPSSVEDSSDRLQNPLLQKMVTGAHYFGFSYDYGLPALLSLTLTSSVEQISYPCFERCSNLIELIFEGATPPVAEEDAFSGLPYNCIIKVPQGSLSDYTSAEYYPDPAEYTYVEYPVD